jgi:hypothetical protein
MKTCLSRVALAMVVAAAALLIQSPARADGAVSERIPAETTVTTCGGTVIAVAGEFHVVTYWTIDESGGAHALSHVNTVGLTGTDPVTGATYRGNAGVHSVYSFSGGGASEWTTTQTIVLVGQGRAPDMLVRYQFKYTMSADGDLAVSFINMTAECR